MTTQLPFHAADGELRLYCVDHGDLFLWGMPAELRLNGPVEMKLYSPKFNSEFTPEKRWLENDPASYWVGR